MKINNDFFNKYKSIINDLSSSQMLDQNIKHILYIVIPAFVYKYGYEKEDLILKCLKSTFFVISNESNSNQEAFFDRKLIKLGNKYIAQKYIVINGLIKSEYIDLIDSIVHEFNHAVNSMLNDVVYEDDIIKFRTGLSYVECSKYELKKSDNYILEEVINTKQSEEIISIIYNFKYDGDDLEIKNLLNTVLREKKSGNYESNAYSIFMESCKGLLENRTFIKTIEIYRLNGDVDCIEKWFDDICGIDGEYNKLIKHLIELDFLIKKYDKSILKNRIKNKILNIMKQISDISNNFNNSTVYR